MNDRLQKNNTGIYLLFFAFLLGILLGTLWSFLTVPFEMALPIIPDNGEAFPALLALLWLPAVALLLATSTMGYKLIPILLLVRGYLLSASVTIFLQCGLKATDILLVVGAPAFFSVPAFFLLCEDAAASSRILCLCSESGLIRGCGCFQSSRLWLSGALLAFAAWMQIYFLPLIV